MSLDAEVDLVNGDGIEHSLCHLEENNEWSHSVPRMGYEEV